MIIIWVFIFGVVLVSFAIKMKQDSEEAERIKEKRLELLEEFNKNNEFFYKEDYEQFKSLINGWAYNKSESKLKEDLERTKFENYCYYR